MDQPHRSKSAERLDISGHGYPRRREWVRAGQSVIRLS
jgi:hypothetical protein